jgi:hypothetical protein
MVIMMKITAFVAALVLLVTAAGALSSSSSSSRPTIAVCTGIDCRLDGATDCLRAVQRNAPAGARVTGRPCVGPCGDGPCVLVLDEEDKRVVQSQDDLIKTSLAPPEKFGANPRGVYQIRTRENLERVLQIASDAAGVESSSNGVKDTTVSFNGIISTRQLFDRPRNERKVMQRLMQSMVLVGLNEFENVGNMQLLIAAALFLLSEFIMKENIFTLIRKTIGK